MNNEFVQKELVKLEHEAETANVVVKIKSL